MATVDVRRELALPVRGEPRLFPAAELRRLMSAAFMVAAAARETEEDRGEGVSRRLRCGSIGGAVEYGVRVCRGEDDVEREGGRELRSGAIVEEYRDLWQTRV
jgi:hypothetical protein